MTELALNKIKDIVADLFLVPVETIGLESSPGTIERWDSLQQLNLVLAVEQTFGIQLSPEDIEQMKNVGLIVKLIEKKIS